MADTSVAITPGQGVNIDGFSENLHGNIRQAIVIADPTTNNGVAPVDGVNGLSVQIVPALPAGNNNIGHVTPDGTVSSGSVDTGNPVKIGGKYNATPPVFTDGKRGDIQIDQNGNVMVTIAGGLIGGATEVADNTAHTLGDKGKMMLVVRRDANTTIVDTDGKYSPLQVTNTGALKVAITSGAGSGGTSIADQASFTSASTSVTPIGGLYQSSDDSLASGVAAAIAIDVARNVRTHEQYAPTAEDNVNNVIATLTRPVAGSTYSATPFTSFGSSAAISVKASAGQLFSIIVSNKNTAVRWLQIVNKASAPTLGDVPILSIPIGAGSANNPVLLPIGRDILGQGGRYCSVGVAIGISSTEGTFTAATATDHDVYGEFI